MGGIHEGARRCVDCKRGGQTGDIFYRGADKRKKVGGSAGIWDRMERGSGGAKRKTRGITVIYSIKGS